MITAEGSGGTDDGPPSHASQTAPSTSGTGVASRHPPVTRPLRGAPGARVACEQSPTPRRRGVPRWRGARPGPARWPCAQPRPAPRQQTDPGRRPPPHSTAHPPQALLRSPVQQPDRAGREEQERQSCSKHRQPDQQCQNQGRADVGARQVPDGTLHLEPDEDEQGGVEHVRGQGPERLAETAAGGRLGPSPDLVTPAGRAADPRARATGFRSLRRAAPCRCPARAR